MWTQVAKELTVMGPGSTCLWSSHSLYDSTTSPVKWRNWAIFTIVSLKDSAKAKGINVFSINLQILFLFLWVFLKEYCVFVEEINLVFCWFYFCSHHIFSCISISWKLLVWHGLEQIQIELLVSFWEAVLGSNVCITQLL